MPSVLAFLALAALQGALAVAHGERVEEGPPTPPPLPTTAGSMVRGMLRPRMAADLLWISAMSYFADPRFDETGHPGLAATIHLAANLDPGFTEVFRYGGMALAGHRKNLPQGLKLLEYGEQAAPMDSFLPFLRGALLQSDGRAREAAAAYRVAADRPGAPPYLKPLAERLETHGIECRTLLALLHELADTDPGKGMRERERNTQLECMLRQLETTRDQHPELPKGDVAALLAAAGLAGWKDPFGGAFVMDPDGTVRSTTGRPRTSLEIPAQEERETP